MGEEDLKEGEEDCREVLTEKKNGEEDLKEGGQV